MNHEWVCKAFTCLLVNHLWLDLSVDETNVHAGLLWSGRHRQHLHSSQQWQLWSVYQQGWPTEAWKCRMLLFHSQHIQIQGGMSRCILFLKGWQEQHLPMSGADWLQCRLLSRGRQQWQRSKMHSLSHYNWQMLELNMVLEMAEWSDCKCQKMWSVWDACNQRWSWRRALSIRKLLPYPDWESSLTDSMSSLKQRCLCIANPVEV